MKLPGDSDKQDKGVSHEMMQRSLQSQRRVVQRVGLLEDKVDALESAEIEPGIDLGEIADGAKKIATKIGDKAREVAPKIGKNAQLLGDKAKQASQAAGEKLGAAGQSVKDNVGKATDKLTDVGKGIRSFIGDKAKLAKSMKLPTLGSGKSKPSLPSKTSGTETVKPPAPTTQPLDPLIPDPIAAEGKDKDGNTIYDKNERVRKFLEAQGKPVPAKYAAPEQSPKVDALEDVGIGEDDVKQNVKKDLEDNLEIDPKMKRAFMDALALPAKSAAVAMTDLLEKIPAPSKEASKILNRNISKISNSFKLGAASAEVANDEEDNDKKDEKAPSLLSALIGKAINFVRGKSGGGESEGGEQQQLPSAPQQNLLPGAAGDPTHGRRAPYTGTADGIGLGDGSGRAMQPIKKRKSAAAKLFGMTPMGMAFNAGNTMFKGAKSFTQSKAFNNIKNIGGKALGMTPMGMMAKFMMKGAGNVKNLFSKGEQKVNLTELTDKTIQENRASADAKTQKQVDLAAGTGDAIDSAMPSSPSYDQEGGALAQPNIKESPYLDVYNVTSQF
jgi:hypothetical protein